MILLGRQILYIINYETLADSFCNCLRFGVNVQLFVNIGYVRANGSHTDEAAGGNHFVTIAPYQAAQHIDLTGG